MTNWCAVLHPDCYGYLVRWYARKGQRTVEFPQLPELRVAGAESIVVRSQTPLMNEVTGLAAAIERDDGTTYMIAFNAGAPNGDEEKTDSRRTDGDGVETTSDGTHQG